MNRRRDERARPLRNPFRLLGLIPVTCVLLISACTSSGPTTARAALSSSPAPRGQHYAPATLLTAQQAKGLTSLPWRLVAVHGVSPSIDIYYVAGGGCTSPRGIYLAQSGTSVTIEAVGLTQHPAGTECTANLLTGYVRVPLARPLASRSLIHAAVDPGWDSANYLR